MGKKLVMVGLVLCLWTSAAAAEIIHLKNGRSIRAKILEKNDQQIKVDISGVKITYYWDEIDRIEETEKQERTNSLPSTSDKKALILTLIEESGTKDTMAKMFDQIIAGASPAEAGSLKKLLNIEEITLRLVPIYDKYFTEDDLQELIGFYRSPTGRRLIEVMPMIMEDSMQATLLYFQEKMPARQSSSQ